MWLKSVLFLQSNQQKKLISHRKDVGNADNIQNAFNAVSGKNSKSDLLSNSS